MEMMQIGTSKVQAPKLILGTFGVGGGTVWQDTTDNDQELIDFIQEAHAAGINAIDTAPVYGLGRAERLVGEAVKPDREKWFIATKCSLNWRTTEGLFEYSRNGLNVYRNFAKKSLIADVEESLKRLNMDYIDLMIVHRCPKLEEIPEVMEALQELKDRELILSTGFSNVGATDYAIEALETAVKYGELDLVQEHASLLFRDYLGDFLKACEKHQITFQDHTGLEKGALAGKFIENVNSLKGDSRANYRWFQPEGIAELNQLTAELKVLAEKYDCSVPVLALAWLKAQSPLMNLLVGARRMSSILDTMKVDKVNLTKEDAALMTELAKKLDK